MAVTFGVYSGSTTRLGTVIVPAKTGQISANVGSTGVGFTINSNSIKVGSGGVFYVLGYRTAMN